MFIPHKSVDRNYSAGNDAASKLVGTSSKLWLVWNVLKLKKQSSHKTVLSWLIIAVTVLEHSRSSPVPSFWHFSSDRVQTQTRLWLRLIKSTLEIMRDYTLVCEYKQDYCLQSSCTSHWRLYWSQRKWHFLIWGAKVLGRAILSTAAETARIPT